MGKPFFKFSYKGFHGCDCVCDLEIYGNLVVCTERNDNEGTSITNMAEHLATEICKRFDITPAKLIWIERYPEERNIAFDESLSLVFFNLTGGTHFEKEFEFSKPRWVPIERRVFDAFIETHKE